VGHVVGMSNPLTRIPDYLTRVAYWTAPDQDPEGSGVPGAEVIILQEEIEVEIERLNRFIYTAEIEDREKMIKLWQALHELATAFDPETRTGG